MTEAEIKLREEQKKQFSGGDVLGPNTNPAARKPVVGGDVLGPNPNPGVNPAARKPVNPFGATNAPIINAFDKAGQASFEDRGGFQGNTQAEHDRIQLQRQRARKRAGKTPVEGAGPLNPAARKQLNPKARFAQAQQTGNEVEKQRFDPRNPEERKTIITALENRGFAPGQDPQLGMLATKLAIERMGGSLDSLQAGAEPIPQQLRPQTSNLGIPGQGIDDFLQRLRGGGQFRPNPAGILGALGGN
jgi:hypothetical protein